MKLTIDGMLSGTGIRDIEHGGYVDPVTLGLNANISASILEWLNRYAEQHYYQFKDLAMVKRLDEEGMKLADLLRGALPEAEVRYYSHAHMRYL